MWPDIKKVMKHVSSLRNRKRLNDEVQLKMKRVVDNKSPLRDNRVRQVMHFVGEIKDLQDKLLEREMERREISPDDLKAKLTPRDLKIDLNVGTQNENTVLKDQIIIPQNKK